MQRTLSTFKSMLFLLISSMTFEQMVFDKIIFAGSLEHERFYRIHIASFLTGKEHSSSAH